MTQTASATFATPSNRSDANRSTRDRKDAYVRSADSNKHADPMDAIMAVPVGSARSPRTAVLNLAYSYLKDSLGSIRAMAHAGLGGHGFNDDSGDDAVMARAYLNQARALIESLPYVPYAVSADYQRAYSFYESAKLGMPSLWRPATTPAATLQRIVALIPSVGRDWGAYDGKSA